jgi:hypothetical protein
MGSKLFAINLHKYLNYNGNGDYKRGADFDKCLYLTKMKDDSIEQIKEAYSQTQKEMVNLFMQHPKYIEWNKSNIIKKHDINTLIRQVLGEEDFIEMSSKSTRNTINLYKTLEYEAIINKNIT